MRIRAIAALVAVTGSVAVPVVSSEASTAVAAPVAHIACIHARVGGHRVCLAPGRSCKRRYESRYLQYGLTCVKRNGHYKLQYAQQQQG